MSFMEYEYVEYLLRREGHRLKRTYIGFEGDLRIISTRNGQGEYRWRPIYNEYEEIVAIEPNP